MPKNPNAPGGGNRQGPKISKGASKGPITSSWGLNKGKPSGAGRNMSGSNWTKKPPH